MALDITAGAAPIFLSRPYITSDAENNSDLIATKSQALVHRIYQMDPTAIWATVGSTDSDTEVITSGLWFGSMQVSRSIDLIAILNTNLKNFLLEYSNDNGATWTTFVGGDYSVANLGAADFVLPLAAPVTANKIRLTMYTTQTTLDKYIGVFECAKSTFQPSKPPISIKAKAQQFTRRVNFADGTFEYTNVMWSDNSFTLNDCDLVFDLVSAADKALYDALFAANSSFLVYIEPGDAVRSLHLFTLKPGSYLPEYTSQFKGAGYKVAMALLDMGYL